MTDAQVMHALIGCYYNGPVSRDQVRRLHGSAREQQIAWLLRLPGIPACVLRATRSELPNGEHLSGCTAGSQRELAHSRMTTLQQLETLGYPAPRVIRTRDGELTTEANGWCAHVTTYIDGAVIRRPAAGPDHEGGTWRRQ